MVQLQTVQSAPPSLAGALLTMLVTGQGSAATVKAVKSEPAVCFRQLFAKGANQANGEVTKKDGDKKKNENEKDASELVSAFGIPITLPVAKTAEEAKTVAPTDGSVVNSQDEASPMFIDSSQQATGVHSSNRHRDTATSNETSQPLGKQVCARGPQLFAVPLDLSPESAPAAQAMTSAVQSQNSREDPALPQLPSTSADVAQSSISPQVQASSVNQVLTALSEKPAESPNTKAQPNEGASNRIPAHEPARTAQSQDQKGAVEFAMPPAQKVENGPKKVTHGDVPQIEPTSAQVLYSVQSDTNQQPMESVRHSSGESPVAPHSTDIEFSSQKPPFAFHSLRLTEHIGGPELQFTWQSDSGDIQLNTSLRQHDVQMTVRTERADAAVAMRAELPVLDSRLHEHSLRLGDVNFVAQGHSASAGLEMSGQHQGNREWKPSPAFVSQKIQDRAPDSVETLPQSFRNDGRVSVLV